MLLKAIAHLFYFYLILNIQKLVDQSGVVAKSLVQFDCFYFKRKLKEQSGDKTLLLQIA